MCEDRHAQQILKARYRTSIEDGLRCDFHMNELSGLLHELCLITACKAVDAFMEAHQLSTIQGIGEDAFVNLGTAPGMFADMLCEPL